MPSPSLFILCCRNSKFNDLTHWAICQDIVNLIKCTYTVHCLRRRYVRNWSDVRTKEQ